MFALLFWFAAAAASAAPAIATPQLHELFTTDDYPADALRRGEHGTVAARMKIDASGAVIDCTIARSSGSALLDATTCAVIRARAHYSQLTDADGRAPLRYDGVRIKWVIPSDGRLPVIDGYARYTFDLAANGALSNCVPEFNGKPWEATYCDATVENFQKFDSSARELFASEGRKLAFLDGYVVGRDADGSLLTSFARGGHVHGLTTSLTIDQRGVVIRCETIFYDWHFAPGDEESPCKLAGKEKFIPLAKSDANRAPRSLTKIAAVVVSN